MEIKNYFFIIFLITILLTRIILYVNPTPSPTIKGIRFHHYMYGAILAPLGILFNSVVIFSIGFGLFVDELGYLLIGGKNHEDNYSKISLLLLFGFITLIYFFREKLLFWI
ncbi:MAG: hypothetical protein ABFQ65_00225 [Nanoarchaeota archaeon]